MESPAPLDVSVLPSSSSSPPSPPCSCLSYPLLATPFLLTSPCAGLEGSGMWARWWQGWGLTCHHSSPGLRGPPAPRIGAHVVRTGGTKPEGGQGSQPQGLLPQEGGRRKSKHHSALLWASCSQPCFQLQEHPKSCLFPDHASKEEQTMPSCHDIFNDESFS